MSRRPVLDVSRLPDIVFGNRGMPYWGAAGLIIIEGTTIALCAMAYLYLRRNFDAWPPPRIGHPDLLVPTINVAVLLASLWPAYRAYKAANALHLGATRRWLLASSLVGAVMLLLRGLEFLSLRALWVDSAYGSAAWAVLVSHSVILGIEVIETMCLTVMSYIGPWEHKYFTDISDNSLYWTFVVVTWVPLYVLLFLSPRWI